MDGFFTDLPDIAVNARDAFWHSGMAFRDGPPRECVDGGAATLSRRVNTVALPLFALRHPRGCLRDKSRVWSAPIRVRCAPRGTTLTAAAVPCMTPYDSVSSRTQSGRRSGRRSPLGVQTSSVRATPTGSRCSNGVVTSPGGHGLARSSTREEGTVHVPNRPGLPRRRLPVPVRDTRRRCARDVSPAEPRRSAWAWRLHAGGAMAIVGRTLIVAGDPAPAPARPSHRRAAKVVA